MGDNFIDRELNDTSTVHSPSYIIDLESEIKTAIKKIPKISRTNGSGLSLVGRSDIHIESESYISTLCLTMLFLPICPLRRYRVRTKETYSKWNTTYTEYEFLWEIPLTRGEKIHKLVVHIGLTLIILLLFLIAAK